VVVARPLVRRIRHVDRSGNESDVLEGVGDPLLFGDDRAADRQDAEGPVGKRKLHHRLGEPGGSTERFCGVPNILCRFGVDIARCIEHHVDYLCKRGSGRANELWRAIIGGCGDENQRPCLTRMCSVAKGHDTSQMMDQLSASLTCLGKQRVLALSIPMRETHSRPKEIGLFSAR
jgi:hypothetical protein